MTLPLLLASVTGENAPVMFKIIFWVLLVLWAVGAFYATPDNVNVRRGTNAVIVILFAILGFYTFGC